MQMFIRFNIWQHLPNYTLLKTDQICEKALDGKKGGKLLFIFSTCPRDPAFKYSLSKALRILVVYRKEIDLTLIQHFQVQIKIVFGQNCNGIFFVLVYAQTYLGIN